MKKKRNKNNHNRTLVSPIQKRENKRDKLRIRKKIQFQFQLNNLEGQNDKEKRTKNQEHKRNERLVEGRRW